MSAESDYIDLTIHDPTERHSTESFHILITQILSHVGYEVLDEYNYRGFYMYIHIQGSENACQVIILLDNLRSDQKKIRYNIQIHDPSKKWPSSVRINRKGRKIFTRQQTKILPI